MLLFKLKALSTCRFLKLLTFLILSLMTDSFLMMDIFSFID